MQWGTLSIFSVVSTIIKIEGPQALFQGLAPTLVGQILYSGFSFSIFETIKESIIFHQETDLTVMQRFTSGAFAGLLAQTISYPLDVVRRRMQIDPAYSPRYRGIWHALITIFREEGLKRGLYKGVSMNWLKGPIAVGTSFTVFETLKKQIEYLHMHSPP